MFTPEPWRQSPLLSGCEVRAIKIERLHNTWRVSVRESDGRERTYAVRTTGGDPFRWRYTQLLTLKNGSTTIGRTLKPSGIRARALAMAVIEQQMRQRVETPAPPPPAHTERDIMRMAWV